jgi:hypothetical protein
VTTEIYVIETAFNQEAKPPVGGLYPHTPHNPVTEVYDSQSDLQHDAMLQLICMRDSLRTFLKCRPDRCGCVVPSELTELYQICTVDSDESERLFLEGIQ